MQRVPDLDLPQNAPSPTLLCMITTRRRILSQTTVAVTLGFPWIRAQAGTPLGQGEHRYRVVPGWGQLGADTPVKNCHGMVRDREGHLILLTDEVKNNVIIYSPEGKLVNKWGNQFPGAHGLSIITEGDREVLYITCLQTHRVVKTTLSGEQLQEWRWPETTGKYSKEADYKPSWTLHHPDGDFYVLDGYGRDYILHYDAKGDLAKVMGGAEGGILHWGPHGGILDTTGTTSLLIAMSDQQHLLRLSLQGKQLQQVNLPGGNPRQIRKQGALYYVAHLADNWPKDRESKGFVSILDEQMRVISNIGGTAPVYDDQGNLQKMQAQDSPFIHPHDLIVDDQGSIYVAQFSSGNTYPVKLERV
jgi:peptidylamidoglycolate lyase